MRVAVSGALTFGGFSNDVWNRELQTLLSRKETKLKECLLFLENLKEKSQVESQPLDPSFARLSLKASASGSGTFSQRRAKALPSRRRGAFPVRLRVGTLEFLSFSA